jgi:hypothetical protein
MDWKGLATLCGKIARSRNQHWKRIMEIQTDTEIHLMEWLVVIMDVEPSWGHVWTPTKN